VTTHEPQTHQFRAYQLVFASAFPIPEMIAAEAHGPDDTHTPDVVIRVADFPDALPDPLSSSAVHEVNADALLIRVAGVGRYLVTDGNEILVDPDGAATDHEIRVYLLGTCIGALLHQRGFLVLHASGVVLEEGCVLFTGESGAGKSTLLAEFLRRGHQMVVDDVCAIRFDAVGRPIVVPSYPRTRLWADAAARLQIDTSRLSRTKSSWDKFERQVTGQFFDRETPLTHVIHLTGPDDSEELTVEHLESIEAFRTLVDNTYRGILLDGMDLRQSHFDLASRAARVVDVTRVSRPDGRDTVEETADLVLAILENA